MCLPRAHAHVNAHMSSTTTPRSHPESDARRRDGGAESLGAAMFLEDGAKALVSASKFEHNVASDGGILAVRPAVCLRGRRCFRGQHSFVASTASWSALPCGQRYFVANTTSWSALLCGQHYFVANTTSWSALLCSQHYFVINTTL